MQDVAKWSLIQRITETCVSVLRIISVLELGAIVPVWILLKKRLKEIEGGEEDAAAEY